MVQQNREPKSPMGPYFRKNMYSRDKYFFDPVWIVPWITHMMFVNLCKSKKFVVKHLVLCETAQCTTSLVSHNIRHTNINMYLTCCVFSSNSQYETHRERYNITFVAFGCVVFLITYFHTHILQQFYDKLRLSWLSKWSFKLTNTICVIHGTIPMG